MFSARTEWNLAPNRFTEAQRELQASGTAILDLTISNPTAAGVHYDAKAISGALNNPAAMVYDPQPLGLRSAREAVAAYYRDGHTLELDPDSILLTTSTSEGYSYIFRLLCNPGDEILVPKPSYPLFEFLADLEDVTLIPYPLIYDHGWQVDFLSLQKSVRPNTRGVVVVHPNNPTGSYVSAQEQAELNNFCRANDLALIVDEVFLDYALDGTPRQTFAANQDVLTFTLSGISKISGLPQMKLSWIATSGPPGQVNPAMARLEVIADTYLSMNAPIQLAAPVMLEQRRRIQPALVERIRQNLSELDGQLAMQKSCTRLAVDGGWYAVLRVPVTQSDEDLAIEILRKTHVLVHPGHFYDFSSDGYLVLSLITPSARFREGIVRMLRLIGR
ncbi:MAG TPA: pyridoxal phosphate-dependent aminotransferase [Terriglobales bacterium]